MTSLHLTIKPFSLLCFRPVQVGSLQPLPWPCLQAINAVIEGVFSEQSVWTIPDSRLRQSVRNVVLQVGGYQELGMQYGDLGGQLPTG